MALEDRYKTVDFPEAIRFLEGRINLPSDSWRDYRDDEFDAAFVSAGAKGSILSDLRVAVDRAISEGKRPEEFQADFERISEGWEHTGDKAWRANLIYQTNLSTAYGRGRETFQFSDEAKRLQPYVQYRHSDARNPRPSHLALDGRVFSKDDPGLWSLPAGFGCECRWISLSQRDVEREGLEPEPLPRGEEVEVTMPDGQTYRPVVGPDEGWNRQPLAAPQVRRQEILENIARRSVPEIAEQIYAWIAAFLADLTGDDNG
jgi:hypothetical protein